MKRMDGSHLQKQTANLNRGHIPCLHSWSNLPPDIRPLPHVYINHNYHCLSPAHNFRHSLAKGLFCTMRVISWTQFISHLCINIRSHSFIVHLIQLKRPCWYCLGHWYSCCCFSNRVKQVCFFLRMSFQEKKRLSLRALLSPNIYVLSIGRGFIS